MKTIFPLFYLLFIPVLLPAEVTLQGSPQDTIAYLAKDQNRVALEGSASTVVEASKASISVRLVAEASTAGSAADNLEAQKKDFLEKLQASGIARGQVKAPKFSTINPRLGNTDTVIGYTAISILTVDIEEQKSYLSLMDLVDKIRGAKVTDVSYDHVQMTNLHKAVLAAACKRILNRKEVYEQILGITLRPVSIQENEGSERPEASDTSPYGQIPVKASVKVIFELIPGAPPATPLAQTSAKPEGGDPHPESSPADR